MFFVFLQRLLFLFVFVELTAGVASAGPQLDVAPLNPAFKSYLEDPSNFRYGYVPPPVVVSKKKSESVRLYTQQLPSRFDLREFGYVTPAKNQLQYNTCWAFAALGALESDLLKEGAPSYDFSENNMVNLSGFSGGFNDGGNIEMAAAYLARGTGPVLASCDPYPNPDRSPLNCKRVRFIENMVLLRSRTSSSDNYFLKSAIYNHGAVFSSIYWDSSFFDSSTNTYYAKISSDANHAVVLVGWDDNMVVPGALGRGAWIAKGSWGQNWADNGFFYISYYDPTLGYSTNAYFVDKPDTALGHFDIYQYDKLGMETSVGCTSTNVFYGANVFHILKTSYIASVLFFVSNSVDYQVSIYTDCDDPSNRPTQAAATFSGYVSNPGYVTVDLPYPVVVRGDTDVCVILKLTTDTANAHPMGTEAQIEGYSDGATIAPGQSYYSCDGNQWHDMYQISQQSGLTNLCIKLLAVELPFNDITSSDVLFALESISDIYYAGITTGCGNGRYCPDQPVTRAQMALFLARALNLPMDNCTDAGFSDVDPDSVYAPGICAIKKAGITTGCGNDKYCPDQPVTRAQMAVFLDRAFLKKE